MVCELLLSCIWFLFVIFWLESISVWLFLCLYYQDRIFYHWGSQELADEAGLLYVLNRVDFFTHTQT